MAGKTKTKDAAAKAVKAAASDGPVKNCTWSNNNAACMRAWVFLTDMVGELDADFDAAETVKMTELVFWNKTGSADARAAAALPLANLMTKFFTKMLGAKYEKGQTYASTVPSLVAILTDADKTVSELAAVVDETHRFLTEG